VVGFRYTEVVLAPELTQDCFRKASVPTHAFISRRNTNQRRDSRHCGPRRVPTILLDTSHFLFAAFSSFLYFC
jgi:hypothetical protein